MVGAERRALSAGRHGGDERHHTMPPPVDHHLLLRTPRLLTTRHHHRLTCARLHGATLCPPRWISTSANEANHDSKWQKPPPPASNAASSSPPSSPISSSLHAHKQQGRLFFSTRELCFNSSSPSIGSSATSARGQMSRSATSPSQAHALLLGAVWST